VCLETLGFREKKKKEKRKKLKEFKAARKNGESGWAVINDRLRYERHVSAVICRENSRMLGLRLDARRPLPSQGNPTLCTAAVSGSG